MANEIMPAATLSWFKTLCGLSASGMGAATRSVTYRKLTAQSINVQTQVRTPTKDSFTLSVTRNDHLRKEGKQQYPGGVTVYRTDVASFVAEGYTSPSAGDQILDGTDLFDIRDFDIGVLTGKVTLLAVKQPQKGAS